MDLMSSVCRRAAVAIVVACSLSLAGQPVTGKAAPKMRTIFLVRHGAYQADPANRSPLEPGLLPLGIAQAKLAGARLAAMRGSFATLLSSPMTRAHETARVIGAELPGLAIEIVPDLAECTPDTRRKEVIKNETPDAMAACSAQIDRFFAQRFVPASGAETREIYVAHGNVIRSLLMRALGVDREAWLEMSVGHASVSEVIVEPDGRFKVISAGDVGHLPPNLQTGATGMSEKTLSVPQ
jgi:serine/threonine-protein phosphatase PGAM5